MVRKPGANVKLLLIGGLVGLAIGVGLTVLYFALAEFFAVNARAACGWRIVISPIIRWNFLSC